MIKFSSFQTVLRTRRILPLVEKKVLRAPTTTDSSRFLPQTDAGKTRVRIVSSEVPRSRIVVIQTSPQLGPAARETGARSW